MERMNRVIVRITLTGLASLMALAASATSAQEAAAAIIQRVN
ncbi:MAG TPA: hypothetical protein VGW38_12440 [Chloroflexota bacterium]|nr:hypothetical protein [Chloroflexota bacterium]